MDSGLPHGAYTFAMGAVTTTSTLRLPLRIRRKAPAYPELVLGTATSRSTRATLRGLCPSCSTDRQNRTIVYLSRCGIEYSDHHAFEDAAA